jgi:hypothetical protein
MIQTTTNDACLTFTVFPLAGIRELTDQFLRQTSQLRMRSTHLKLRASFAIRTYFLRTL